MRPDRPVLVVDDDDSVREVLVEFLRARGLTVVEAANGLEALMVVKRLHPTAVVIDLAMPRVGGAEAVKHIHRFDPEIRVVVVSGHVDRGTARRMLELGASAVLTKPVDLAELATAVG